MHNTTQSGLTRPAVSTGQSDELTQTRAPQALTRRSGTPQRRHTTDHPASEHQRPQPRVQRLWRSTTEPKSHLAHDRRRSRYTTVEIQPLRFGQLQTLHADGKMVDQEPSTQRTHATHPADLKLAAGLTRTATVTQSTKAHLGRSHNVHSRDRESASKPLRDTPCSLRGNQIDDKNVAASTA